MNLQIWKPRQALNKAFLKIKPGRVDIDRFKANLVGLLYQINDAESEEFHKNLVIDFLKKTYYDPRHFVNTKGRNDLVIHNGHRADSSVGIIIEAKKPTNKAEMISTQKPNVKALHELVLYYMRERITHKNIEIKHLIATNINEWYVFDASIFDRTFAQNKTFVQQFEDFENGRLADTKTDFFYKQVAAPFIASLANDLECAYFNFQDYQTILHNTDKIDDYLLIALFKILSPEHLLKLPFANDSNTLDRGFYNELLHIIGLTETKYGGKKLIERSPESERNSGSILEETIIQLDSLDKLSRLPNPKQWGHDRQERLFNVALELSITWINRILFLKLLEGQLVSYHRGDTGYAFLNAQTLKEYDDLNRLFFQVLARKHDKRNEDVKKIFAKIPHLNSSLFEPTELEQIALFVSNLKDGKTMPIYAQTVLKDQQGKKMAGNMPTLQYLLSFLNAYDFSSDGTEAIQEDNKTLINAAVLGLIFEKINGYRDGSFFTPGFITMYMCRQTIRRAVVQKFNEIKKWNCTDLEQLYDKIEDRQEANAIVNSLKICDPAVGSGHFLVSALNEIIAIKSELKILQDRNGRRLKEYHIEILNDELNVIDEDGEVVEYHPIFEAKSGKPRASEAQRLQETLFHEKQTLIENCLFGVDINPNSVKICRLRLWIELLKNSYYKNIDELETLPNIDINIKCGNSLISRFSLDADLKQALKKSKYTIESYRMAVSTYQNATNKEEKREMERLIGDIKSDFRSEISRNDPKMVKLMKTKGELFALSHKQELFEISEKEKRDWRKQIEKLSEEVEKLEAEIEAVKANRIFENAFEWRFEFPAVLNDDGDFVGFDVVMGNPPYVSSKEIAVEQKDILSNYTTAKFQYDLYTLFIEKSIALLAKNGINSLIVPDSLLARSSFKIIRQFMYEKTRLYDIIHIDDVFEEAGVSSCIYHLSHRQDMIDRPIRYVKAKNVKDWLRGSFSEKQIQFLRNEKLNSYRLLFIDNVELSVLVKIFNLESIGNHIHIWRGEELGKKNELLSTIRQNKVSHVIIAGENIGRYLLKGSFYFIAKDEVGKNLEDYQKEKIIVRQVGERINATLDSTGAVSTQSVYNIFSKNANLSNMTLLGILNSKLVNFVYVNVYAEKQLFPRILIENIRNLTVPNLKLSDTFALENIVRQVLLSKQQNPTANTSALEAEIDRLVYKLYDLTAEEIRVIEKS